MGSNNIHLVILFAKKNILIKFNCITREGTKISCLLSKYDKMIKKYIKFENQKLQFSIFGNKKNLSYQLKDGDRIEICEMLQVDPIIRRKNILSKKK